MATTITATMTVTAVRHSTLADKASISTLALDLTPSPLAALSAQDRRLFYRYGFGPRRHVPIPVVHHGFERHALLQPDAIAVEHLGQSITYRQLDLQANRLARRLRSLGVVPGKRVCLLCRRSIPLVVAIMAVLKAGGQYVPLDAVTIRDSTLSHVLRDAEPAVVLAMTEFLPRLAETEVTTLDLEEVIREDDLANADGSKPTDLSVPSDGAYAIYTSGTTGVPKGVDVRHRGVTNVLAGGPTNVGMRPGRRVSQLLNIAFDFGSWEMLGSLYNGCTLCIRGNTKQEWIALMKTVDIVLCTPSMLAIHDPVDYPNIKHVMVGGEPCPQSLADRWAQFVEFSNCCGPTEVSICNTVSRHVVGSPISIGSSIPNVNTYVLSRDPTCTDPIPIGETGCMWVGGIGVSRGYLNLPEKTRERYRPDPFVPGQMMFNTGDLGRWRPDGQLDHLGRADDQVKLKGFRIELDGVSAAMQLHPSVDNAVSLLVGDELWGFVTPSTVDLQQVRNAAATKQPSYALPTQYLALDVFAQTPNGKVDKQLLRQYAEGTMPCPHGKRFSPPSRA